MSSDIPANRPTPMADKHLSSTVGQYLRVVHRALQEHSRRIEKEFGVSAAQLAALWELSAHPGCRVSELSQALTLHQSTTSNMLDKLEKKGLVERRRGGPDQRVVKVFLSATAQDILARAPRPTQDAISAALERLPQPELAALQHGLASLIGHMDGTAREAALSELANGL